jgi:integrase
MTRSSRPTPCAGSRRPSDRLILRSSSAASAAGPTRPRSSVVSWPPVQSSTGITSWFRWGTGLRSGELLGLRASRVKLEQHRIEVVEVRYDAGKFGVGYKNRPKSDASIRLVPLARPVAEAVARRLVGCAPDGLVFCGPGGGNTLARGVRSKLSIDNYRRVYHRVADRAGLIGLDLHGPHDLRHTFATWLEDGGIPARVIDELMGHHTGRGREHDGSAIGARYRRMTPEMQARVLAVIEQNFASMSQACPKTDEPGQLDG